jgi:hypothetical protein
LTLTRKCNWPMQLLWFFSLHSHICKIILHFEFRIIQNCTFWFRENFKNNFYLLIKLFFNFQAFTISYESDLSKKMSKNTFSAMNISKILPTRIGGTRCLPHMVRSISAFLKDSLPSKVSLRHWLSKMSAISWCEQISLLYY